jgi:H+/Cl- antiporter ClcA
MWAQADDHHLAPAPCGQRGDTRDANVYSKPPMSGDQPQEADVLRSILRSPGYLKILAFCALIGVPVSLAAFWFLVILREMEHAVWVDLPAAMGLTTPPWWWPLPLFLVAGLVVGLVATHLPGAGGHIPASGLHSDGPSASSLPGVLLAALACLPLGAVLGPEAPLIALGGGLAFFFRDQRSEKLPATPLLRWLLLGERTGP